VSDVPQLDFLVRAADGPGGILEQPLLLVRGQGAEQVAGLREVIVVVLAEVPVVGVTGDRQRRLPEVGLFLQRAVAVRLVADLAALVVVDPHLAVAVEGVVRAFRRIHRYLIMVHAEPVALRVAVGEEPRLQHLVGREADTGHHVGRAECGLFHVAEVVFRVPV
jgi:hypothetical protein